MSIQLDLETKINEVIQELEIPVATFNVDLYDLEGRAESINPSSTQITFTLNSKEVTIGLPYMNDLDTWKSDVKKQLQDYLETNK